MGRRKTLPDLSNDGAGLQMNCVAGTCAATNTDTEFRERGRRKNRLKRAPFEIRQKRQPSNVQPLRIFEGPRCGACSTLAQTDQERDASNVMNNTIALFLLCPRLFLNCHLDLPIFICHI